MYQNHRKYNKNRDTLQLMGNTRTESEIDPSCDPIKRIEDLDLNINNPQLSPKSIANPCGLIAKSIFNDTYRIISISPKKSEIKISFNEIS